MSDILIIDPIGDDFLEAVKKDLSINTIIEETKKKLNIGDETTDEQNHLLYNEFLKLGLPVQKTIQLRSEQDNKIKEILESLNLKNRKDLTEEEKVDMLFETLNKHGIKAHKVKDKEEENKIIRKYSI